MSRSALWRQEGNVVERQRKAQETFDLALEEGRVRKNIFLPLLFLVACICKDFVCSFILTCFLFRPLRYSNRPFILSYLKKQARNQKNLCRVMNDTSFNLNPMLLQNISNSPYFQKCCNNLTSWNTLVDEIYYEVKSLEPWSNGE